MTLTGSLGVFIAADMVSFYLFYTLVSLAAYGLVIFDGTAASRRAGTVYVSLALLGEAFLLIGFVLDATLLVIFVNRLRAPGSRQPGRQPAHPRCRRCARDVAVA